MCTVRNEHKPSSLFLIGSSQYVVRSCNTDRVFCCFLPKAKPHLVQAGALPSHLPPVSMRYSLPSFCVKPTGVLWKLSSKNLFMAVSGLGCCSGCCNKSWALRLSPAANELRTWANRGTAPILLAYLRGLGATLEPFWALLSIIPGTEHSPWPVGTWRLAPLGRIPNFFVKMVFCMTCEIRMGGLNQ